MTARRKKPQQAVAAPLSTGAMRHLEEHADGPWLVSTWPGRPGDRDYRCPVCGSRLAAGVAHLVVWPQDSGPQERRHVHTACWKRRAAQRDPVRW